MNVTEQINRSMVGSGGGSSRPEYFSINKSLNYAKGSNSLLNATQENVTAIPYSTTYKDSVGLFGAENVFIKVQLNIQNSSSLVNGIIVNDYNPSVLDTTIDDSDLYWDTAFTDYELDLTTVNTYEPAEISNDDIEFVPNGLVKINLTNLKTGNKYIDCWFDTGLYTPDRRPYEYDTMFVSLKGFFYIGFHARDTKRLPYNVSMTVEDKLYAEADLTSEERKYLVS